MWVTGVQTCALPICPRAHGQVLRFSPVPRGCELPRGAGSNLSRASFPRCTLQSASRLPSLATHCCSSCRSDLATDGGRIERGDVGAHLAADADPETQREVGSEEVVAGSGAAGSPQSTGRRRRRGEGRWRRGKRDRGEGRNRLNTLSENVLADEIFGRARCGRGNC